MKKIVSLLLVVCFLLTALLACGEAETQAPTGGENKGTTTETDQFGQQKFISAVPVDSLDFNQEKIVLLCRTDEVWYREWGKKADELGDDVLDQAINTRNEKVYSDLNLQVDIVRMPLENTTNDGFKNYLYTFNKLIKSDVESKLHEYDIVSAFAYGASDLEIRDLLANMNNKDVFPYFDFTLPCWNQTMTKNIIINDRLYCMAGDINLSMFDRAMIVWCNKDLYNECKNSDDPDIQDLALSEDGFLYTDFYKWSEFTKTTSSNNGECDDIFGTCISSRTMYDSFIHAWDIDLVTRNNDNTHSYNIKGNKKAEECLEMLRGLIKMDGMFPGCTCNEGSADAHFVKGDIIFNLSILYPSAKSNEMLRNMEDEYCLLPVPKYNEDQENYGTTSADSYNLITVIDHWNSTPGTKGEAVSAYLQYATELSYTDVRGMYFGKIVEPKFFGTDDEDGTVTKSIEVFNLIIDNLQFDAPTVYSSSMDGVFWLWRDVVVKQTTLEEAFISPPISFFIFSASSGVKHGIILLK